MPVRLLPGGMTAEGDRHRPFTAAYLLLFDGDRVLLSERRNTGHRDGDYSLVAGHIEAGESARAAMVREAREEVGISLDASDLEGVHVIHRNAGTRVYLDVFFEARRWGGEVTNEEPGKCADLVWRPADRLPPNTVPYVEQAIANRTGDAFSEFGWD